MFKNLQQRRKILVIISGSLILFGLGADQFFEAQVVYNLAMSSAALVAGWDIAMRAWTSLRSRHVSIEMLVTIATVGALLIGEYWEAAAVTFLFLLGAYLEARTLGRTRQVLKGLLDLAPSMALVLRDERQVEVLPHEVEPGEMVLVKPGTKIPVDGSVIEGNSAVDESAITGEPMPEEKIAGSTVFAGTVNQNSLLKVRATGVGSDTTLARIIRRVEEAQDEKAPTQRFIERFARWYTPFIILLSLTAYLITRDIDLALTLLVIGCPGALVISTPVSIVAGIGQAAKAGILIKGGEYLENAGRVSALALDKTGTLTQGKPRVTDVMVFDDELLLPVTLPGPATLPAPAMLPVTATATLPATATLSAGQWLPEQAAVLYWAGIVESGSEHPLARSILAEASSLGVIPSADRFDAYPGRGGRAVYQGHSIDVGSTEWIDSLGSTMGSQAKPALDKLKSEGKTTVLVALDGVVIGAIGISDPIRPSAAAMIRGLKEAGIQRITMLTGDDRLTAQRIAEMAGIDDVRAELLPEDKLAVIRDLQAQGYVVAMVGDGINDAPALAAANIGIAMGAAGSDVAIETAAIALMADDLMKISEAMRISKATLRNIRQNVLIALVTVTGLLLGVLLGEVHMAGGMLIHEASVLIVILNGMRLLRA